MNDFFSKEIRNIRITLVVLTVIMAFTSGNKTVTVDNSGSQQVYPEFNYSNLVNLGDGYFGVLNDDTSFGDGEQLMKVYYYDKKEHKVILKSETALSELQINK